jgi:hypothetical protein
VTSFILARHVMRTNPCPSPTSFTWVFSKVENVISTQPWNGKCVFMLVRHAQKMFKNVIKMLQ